MGIYVVEPQYMDYHRKRAEQRAADRMEKAKKRQEKENCQGKTETGNPLPRKRVRIQDDKANPSARKKARAQQVLPDITSHATPSTNQLIVIEPHHQNYEAAAMDAYVNARTRGICRRRVAKEFFGNRPGEYHDLRGDFRIDPWPASLSLACSNSDCRRCAATVSRLCCDSCNPDSFFLPTPTTTAPKQTRAPNKFKVDKSKYKMVNADESLTSALRQWRDAQLVRIGIPAGDEMYGSQLIMTDDILERIVELPHFSQLGDLASMKAQVNWRYNDQWGAQILEITSKFSSPSIDSPNQSVPPSHRPMLQPTGTENIPGSSVLHQFPDAQTSAFTPAANPNPKPRARNRYKCSTCGSPTHIGTFILYMLPCHYFDWYLL